ncbi:alpha/beta fold hydrolase [Streptosporangium jomthongense]|uniref:Alpha/beta fold hydrolase n=1 Tax=Streptosporangium jomthongense TaxID=1193683 RepID=A0ABV8F245_9ACTN
MTPDSIVFGAAGFIGRSLVAELLRRERVVAAALRGPADRLTSWLAGQGVDTARLTVVTADIAVPGLGLGAAPDLGRVRDVYNTAARFAFGLGVAEARAANVTGAVNVADWAATRQGLRRLVHVSGYRVSGGPPDYRRDGAYEASKREGDAAVRARAAELGVPLTVVNPSSVTGEGQFIGLASVVRDLWRGRLPLLPGDGRTFLPVVDIGYLARFMAEVPGHEETAGEAYWVLDDRTPNLPELAGLLAAHLGVRPPRATIPVPLVRRLPRALTGADPETLSFMSGDRYETAPALAFAERAGLRMPPVEEMLRTWADGLVGAGFGEGEAPRGPYGFRDVAGSRTWVAGERESPRYVLLHGLPLDARSWAEVSESLDGPVLAADLPGLGRSSPARSLGEWTEALLEPAGTRPVLVGHSFACGPVLRYALARPERISAVVLLAPAFLQAPAGWPARSAFGAAVLRGTSPARLAGRLGVPEGALADLRRPGAARRVIGAMRAGYAAREELRRALGRAEVPVTIVTGAADPLVVGEADVVIEGAGHYPQLTHPRRVARVLREAAGRVLPARL